MNITVCKDTFDGSDWINVNITCDYAECELVDKSIETLRHVALQYKIKSALSSLGALEHTLFIENPTKDFEDELTQWLFTT